MSANPATTTPTTNAAPAAPSVNLGVSEPAATEIKKFMSSEEGLPETAGLRVRVVPGGCSGFQYSLNIEEESRQGDFILDEKGAPLVNDIVHVPNPAGPAGVFHYHYSQQLAIPKYSKNVDTAKEFLRWLMDKEQFTKYLRRAQAYHGAALKVYLKDAMWDMFPALKPFRDHLLEGRPVGWKGAADANAARVVQNYVLIDILANVATG